MLDTVNKNQTKVTVLNPMGYPPKVTKKSGAARLDTLDGKTIYLVDCRFDDSIELLKQIEAWFTKHMPSVTTKAVSLSNYYGHDDPTPVERDQGAGPRRDPRRRPLQHLRTGGDDARDHGGYQVRHSAVALHTHIFDRVVTSYRKVQARQRPRAFVPQPVMGKSPDELMAYVEGTDPVAGKPVMQEVIEGLTRGVAADASRRRIVRGRGWLRPTPRENLHKLFLENHWTDTLPIVLPTEERVAEMLAGHQPSAADKVVGRMQATANRGQ